MASTFRFVWDGNVLLHETFKKDNSENTELTTWVFEGFVPTAKLVNGKAYSIISDHLGTPILAIDSEGNEVWNRQLDIYGRVKREIKASSLGDDVHPFIPFLYQGQYYDFETNLAYNRFRYYSPETGAYISQDPIRLAGGNPTLYGYVKDSNWWVDVFGLDGEYIGTVYRGMKKDSNGDPIVYSGKTEGGNNAANSLGVRYGNTENPNDNGAMSTNKDIDLIEPQRKTKEYDGKLSNNTASMFSIETNSLSDFGLKAIDDNNKGHVSIVPIEGKGAISDKELGERLASTKKEWKKCPKKQ